MKWNGWKQMVALVVGICALAAISANAQMVTSLQSYNGSFILDRFGTSDGRLVAYGWLDPSERVNMSSLRGWTGIGTGYGESGVESRSNMISDNDGRLSVRTSDDFGRLDVRLGPTSGNDRLASGL